MTVSLTRKNACDFKQLQLFLRVIPAAVYEKHARLTSNQQSWNKTGGDKKGTGKNVPARMKNSICICKVSSPISSQKRLSGFIHYSCENTSKLLPPELKHHTDMEINISAICFRAASRYGVECSIPTRFVKFLGAFYFVFVVGSGMCLCC